MAEKIVKGKEKVTWMKLTTKPLDNPKNEHKVQKALCACPHRVFDEKSNTVTIKVVCCSPEKVMDRLCKKGDGAICRIETFDPHNKSTTEKPKTDEKPKDPEKPKDAEKPKEPEKPKDAEKPKEPEKPTNPAPAGPSSQPMVYSGYYNPVSNESYYAWNQQNGYPERRIYDSYGGGPPPSYYGEEDSVCTLM